MPAQPPQGLEDDRLYTPEVGQWAARKQALHRYYSACFTTAMQYKWNQLCYLGLCTGAGRGRVGGTDEIVETSALSVLRLEVPFTKYVFCDADERAMEALRVRAERAQDELGRRLDIEYIAGDVNEVVGEIERAMPSYGPRNTLLTFCFFDPFSIGTLRFQTIERICGPRNVDLLVQIALGYDVQRNFERYLDPGSRTIELWLGDPEWRERWREVQRRGGANPVLFLAECFSGAMESLRYLPTPSREVEPIRLPGRNVLLYWLAFYSKHPLGKKFWLDSRKHTSEQGSLGLE